MLGDQVLLEVSHMKDVMRFVKKVVLSIRFMMPFEFLEKFGNMVYC